MDGDKGKAQSKEYHHEYMRAPFTRHLIQRVTYCTLDPGLCGVIALEARTHREPMVTGHSQKLQRAWRVKYRIVVVIVHKGPRPLLGFGNVD